MWVWCDWDVYGDGEDDYCVVVVCELLDCVFGVWEIDILYVYGVGDGEGVGGVLDVGMIYSGASGRGRRGDVGVRVVVEEEYVCEFVSCGWGVEGECGWEVLMVDGELGVREMVGMGGARGERKRKRGGRGRRELLWIFWGFWECGREGGVVFGGVYFVWFVCVWVNEEVVFVFFGEEYDFVR